MGCDDRGGWAERLLAKSLNPDYADPGVSHGIHRTACQNA
jgi:hypothetical protein